MTDPNVPHESQFDPVRDEAYDFVVHDLGLTPAPKENIGLVGSSYFLTQRTMQAPTVAGEYNPLTNTAVVEQKTSGPGRHTLDTSNRSAAVHEITHTANGRPDEHMFFYEGLAGIAEAKYLERRQRLGQYLPAFAFTLRRAGVELWLPANFRYLDARDASGLPSSGEKGGHASQALIAALGIAHALPSSKLKSADLLASSNQRSPAAYFNTKRVLNDLRPGLAKEVESFPETTDGIIQATAQIQAEARKQGLL